MYVVYINLLYFLSIFLFTYNKNLLSQKKTCRAKETGRWDANVGTMEDQDATPSATGVLLEKFYDMTNIQYHRTKTMNRKNEYLDFRPSSS